MAPARGRGLVWAKVARAAAQAMSQWLAGLDELRPSVKTHLVPEKTLRRAKKSAAMSYSGRGNRFSATESWFMRAKPRSDFLALKLTLRKRLENWVAASSKSGGRGRFRRRRLEPRGGAGGSRRGRF